MLLASAGSAQQRTWMYYSNAKSKIGPNTTVNIKGPANKPMGLLMRGTTLIDNNGRIYLYGDFVNECDPSIPNVFVFPKTPNDPTQSELRFLGDQISEIRGTRDTRFNNLYIKKTGHSVPVVQLRNSFIDEPSILTIDGSQLSNCYAGNRGLQYPAAKMVVFNTDPKAVVSVNQGFVGADDDAKETDKYVPRGTKFHGGRLVWYMKDHAGEEYVFPVGNINLPQYLRRVTIVNKNSEERIFAVRCVGKDAESDGYDANVNDNPTVCKLNQFFYHIIDDSTDFAQNGVRDDETRVVDLKIQYEKSDGVFNDIGVFDNNLRTGNDNVDRWKDLKSTDEGTHFFKEDWNDFDHPVFALYPVKALDGLNVENLTKKLLPSFRVTDKLKFSDNEENIDGLTYEWKMEYLDKSSDPPKRILVGTSSNRYPEYPSDFGVDPGPPTITPGEYCFSVRVKNPAAPTDEECEGKGDTCLFLLPERAAYVPDGFSPNSNGTNDEWVAWFYGFSEVSLEIFNRWGLLIYTKTFTEKDGLDSPSGVRLWNARTNDNDVVPEGAYVYKLRMVTNPPEMLDKVWEKNGMITVVR